MTADEFNGRWERRGGILRPVLDPAPDKILCRVCGSTGPAALCRPCRESSTQRVHGSHAGFAQHQRRHENPCQACSDAEKVYQGARYRRGQLSKVDREWCEKQAVKGSWLLDERTNRRASVTVTTTRGNHHD
jgi:hypothetical protein